MSRGPGLFDKFCYYTNIMISDNFINPNLEKINYKICQKDPALLANFGFIVILSVKGGIDMSTPHNSASLEDIAKVVIMPGDPLRAKYIAENFLDDYKLVNEVRNMFAYTGYYKDKKITVMASGMGMPSIGIYSYELYKFYNVENIIRIGSCGGYSPDLKLFDIILSEQVFSESNFALSANNENCHLVSASTMLNGIIDKTSKEINIPVVKGTTVCTEAFDLYMSDLQKVLDRIPENLKPIGSEMEAFALFYTAKMLNKNAACLMSVVDTNVNSNSPKANATAEERQTGLNNMIKLALESAIKIDN